MIFVIQILKYSLFRKLPSSDFRPTTLCYIIDLLQTLSFAQTFFIINLNP